ncbi:MAG: helix-turn-helix transcriptional regulator [Burkholderiales bacterium]|nr:helix-turn-helix transcriptional regulator [Burkholderiales bacterium]
MTSPLPHGESKADLEPLLYRIHASSDACADWSPVLERLRSRYASRLATLTRFDFGTGQGTVLCEAPVNPAFAAGYPSYASRNPWFLSSEPYSPGRVLTGDELLANREFVKSDFYRGLLRPHGLLHSLFGVVARRGDVVHCVGFLRGDAEARYGEREKAGVRTMLAHLSLAFETRWRLRESADFARALMGIIDRHAHASWLVDGDCRIVHANRSASALAAVQGGVLGEEGRLVAAAPIDRAALRAAIRDVTRAMQDDGDATRAVTLSVPGGRHSVVVAVHPAGRMFQAGSGETRPLALVTARSSQVEHDVGSCSLVKQFRLSPAQARLSVLIVTGHSLADAASKLHVSENTARSHLKQVFQKTNTHGQMELVHLHARHCSDHE